MSSHSNHCQSLSPLVASTITWYSVIVLISFLHKSHLSRKTFFLVINYYKIVYLIILYFHVGKLFPDQNHYLNQCIQYYLLNLIYLILHWNSSIFLRFCKLFSDNDAIFDFCDDFSAFILHLIVSLLSFSSFSCTF